MKILMLTYQGDPAGSTQSVIFLCRRLAALGHEIFLGARPESLIYRTLESSAVKCVPMSFDRFGGAASRQIAELVAKEGIRIVNAQSSQDRYAAMRARFFHGMQAKVVFTRRQMPDSSRLSGLLASLGAHRIIAVSRAVADALAERWVARSKLEVVYNGTPREKYEHVDPADTARLRQELDIPEGRAVIGCIARRKRQDILLRALPYLPEDAVILLVGEGEVPEWKAIVDEIKPRQRVLMLPHSDNILPYYGLLTVSVLPSLIEGLSQTVLESMMLGVPVAASRWGGNPEIVQDGECGLLFEPLSPKDLADKINRILKDGELRARFIERGRQRVLEEFTVERTAERTLEVFERLLSTD